MMKKVVSLLVALVMALGLVVPVWAENDPTIDQLRSEWKNGTDYDPFVDVTDEAALRYVYTNFYPAQYDSGTFVRMKRIDTNGDFFMRESDKTAAVEVLKGYTADIKQVLGTVEIACGASKQTFDWLINLYTDMQNAPLLHPENGSGTQRTMTINQYVFQEDITQASTFFGNEDSYFKYDGDTTKLVCTLEGVNGDGSFENSDNARKIVEAYWHLFPRAQIALNQLQITIPTGESTNRYVYFWELIAMYQQRLNGQGGDDGPGGGEDRRTGTVTDPNTLENETTKKYLADYINYEGTGGQFTIKNAEIDAKTGLYKDEAARQAAIAAYNAFCSLGPNADGLYSLYVKNSRGQECWFYERMEELRQLADNGSGSYTDTDAFNAKLRAAGYVAPVLGRDLKVEFPYQLVRGTDYDYTYDQSNGHLIITIEKGEAQNWLSAAEGIYFTMDSVMVNMTLMNTCQKSGYAFWSGIGEGGTWNQFVDGSVKSTYPEESMQSFGYGDRLAPVNRDGDKISVTSSSDNKTYRVLMVWGDKDEAFKDRTKWLFTYEIKVEESFYYSKAGVSNVGKVEMDRVDTSALGNNWTVDRSEEGVLKLVPPTGEMGEKIGTVTVTAPTGYTFDRDSSYAANGDDRSLNGKTGEDTCTITLYNQYRNTFVLVWKNDTKVIQESLDVYRLDEQLENLGKYDASGETVESSKELLVTKPKAIAATGSASGVTVKYDASTGSFYTTFDKSKSLPSYEELQKGVLLEPDSRIKGEVTHFRAVTQSTGDQVGHSKEDVINLVQGMCAMEENLTYSYTDTQDNSWRTLPYVDTDYQEIGGIQVSYAADQGYRYKIVQWLKQESDGTYTVLGYSYVWGRNDAFINEIQTFGVAAGSVAAGNEPFVIGEGMQLRCDRYPQYGGDGKIQYFQFRAYGDHEGDYIIYIPYEYFGMEKDDGLALRDRGQRPRINHYYEDHTLRETITGEYTEYGVKFTTGSFSPFVVDCSEQSTGGGYYYYGGASTPGISAVKTADAAKSATDYTSGIYGLTFRSTAAFSGFKGVQVDGRTIAAANYVAEDNGGIEVYLKAVYLRTLKDGRHTVTILSDAGNVTMNFTIGGVDSPTTFDAGIGAYVGMALASVGGMAWMRRRKR